MRLHRYLKEENIDLDFRPLEGTEFDPAREEEQDEESPEMTEGRRFKRKVVILERLVDLLVPSGKITNVRKCVTDLRNREAKATTGFGQGVAMPHVRTPQAKDFAIGVAIAPEPGLDFEALDEQPVRIFLPMVAPPYSDKFYRKVEQAFAQAFLDEDEAGYGLRQRLLEARTPGEVILALRDLIDQG
jgi:mannitol/fructose-specific phosphotransferase system IIA component (Ntr-type)